MSRVKDNIDRDVAAMRLGYGVHYGHYKADHPHTIGQENIPEISDLATNLCRYCGREFAPEHGSQKYCSDVCHTEAIRQRSREYYYKQKLPRGQICCVMCGNGFIPTNGHQKYCSKICAGRSKRKREKTQDEEALQNVKTMGEQLRV